MPRGCRSASSFGKQPFPHSSSFPSCQGRRRCGPPPTGLGIEPDTPKCQLLSLLAFICEEVVSECGLCGGLYFFEFVSCSAFLLSLLLLIVYCTAVYDRVDTGKVKSSDFYITLGTGCVFLLASIIFVSTHSGTSAEIAAIVFGFLGSSMFLLDFVVMLCEKLRESPLRKPENNARAEALTEPLNA
uniref:CKLF-like MARVEL transmembrane domain containing 6 n=1 Tax=Rattus norvegicus TaxID=10116 RepID=A0ABK0LNA2_RAT